MKVRILIKTEIEGVEYSPNDVVDLDDKLAKGVVSGGAAASEPEAVAAGLKESGEALSHKAAQNAGSVQALRRQVREAREKAEKA